MYKSPIEIICDGLQTELVKKEENYVMEAIRNIGVNVDKEELMKALQYDRNQYAKGLRMVLMQRLIRFWLPYRP